MTEETTNAETASDPAHDAASANGAAPTDAETESGKEMLGQFPPEIATLLVVAGLAGIPLPGPFGMPLLIAGGVVLWPKTFQPIERWFSKKFPKVHQEGVVQLKEFLNDLNRRFPEDQTEH